MPGAPLYEEYLRGSLKQSLDFFYQKITDLVLATMEVTADKKIGSIESRIGVFGYYAREGKQVLNEVAREVSRLGYAAIMPDGFYLPGQPTKCHDIKAIIPSITRRTTQTLPVPYYIFYQSFPRLVSKSIFALSAIQGAQPELQGCLESEIPSLGFILHRDIDHGAKNCNYLSVVAGYSTCKAPDDHFCPYSMLPRIFCPFYDSICLPWTTKQILMKSPNRMVAISDLKYLSPMLGEFLLTKPPPRLASKGDMLGYCEEFVKIHRQILRKDLNYRIKAIISRKNGSLVFFDFTQHPGSFDYRLTNKPISLELMKLPQTAFGGDLSGVTFGGTNIVRERNKLIIIKGDNSGKAWSKEEAREDAFRELAAVGKILSEEAKK